MNSQFTDIQFAALFTGASLLLVGIITFLLDKRTLSLLLIVCGALSVFLFAAQLDPYLNLWDERFHALVAKNMMNNPLTPMLYRETLFGHDYLFWATGHIWLHKQPLFLWQIAASLKIFGVSELSLRLPSVVLSGITTAVIYKTGKLLVDRNTGFIAALLFISSFYVLELVSGRQMLDHNDISFIAYVSLSIWSWAEYKESGKWKWLILIGVFSGSAMLCKWFVGLLIYLGWGVQTLFSNPRFKEFLPIGLSFLVTTIVFLPWQIYTFYKFPDVAQKEWIYNSLHFSVPVEGHEGPWWYHLDRIGELFGIWTFILLPLGLLLFRRFKTIGMYFGILSMIIGVELFFALAQTKMPSFTIVLASPIFIVTAIPLSSVLTWAQQKLRAIVLIPIVSTLLILMVFIRMDVDQLRENHTAWKKENVYPLWMSKIRNTFISLRPQLNKNSVVYNVYGRNYVQLMFYTDALATNYIPSEEEVEMMIKRGKEVFIFNDNRILLPEYILNDQNIKKLDIKLDWYI